jgi:signal transduction histidine kinase
LGKTALKEYVEHETMPNLPKTYSNEVGKMLRNIQYTIACLDEVDKEKQEIAELISHDLRTPVAQTLQIINFLREDGDNQQEREANLNLLQEIGSKQLKFLEGMLKVLKTKQIEIGFKNFEILAVSEMINDVLDGHKKGMDAQQLKVVNSIPETVKIYGHAFGMNQVFENLITNAIKFSEKSGEILISEKTDGDAVIISIQDNGIGFNKQTEQNLFKKFIPGH